MKNELVRSSMRILLVLLAAVVMLAQPEAEAAKPVAADFACRQVALGADEAAVEKVFGKPVYDRTVRIQDILVKECDYADDYTIGYAVATGEVIDIIVKNKKYEARNGIRYGATSALIQKTFGKQKAQNISGNKFYIYDNPKNRFQHIMLQVDMDNGSLKVMRITALPMDDDEIEALMQARPELFNEPEDKSISLKLEEKEIDVSDLPADKPVKLGGLTE
ncbi:hypothetical protein SAMN02910356_02299 [Selenomonas sp. GACV-9]|uniref:hypothetical protein n=1 Tax=Selenomonas sp. GACV-9 TaxID=3158782 RepID=UPI0008E6E380|nr:hypothetical protein SAMN02910356_02299 [Selenomonas ruminantium]